MTILLVEDEKRISDYVGKGLKEEHYGVNFAYDAEEAIMLADVNKYDLIVMDIVLPDRDGISVCKTLRAKKVVTPILMLTSRDSVKDKVAALNMGADDYLTKPFVFDELLARIRALLRRQRVEESRILKVGDLELNQMTHKANRAGKEIILTNREYALLEFLMLHEGEIVTRTMLSEQVWHEHFDSFTNVIDVHVNYLRNKICKGFDSHLIHTVRGVGYVMRCDRNV